ANLRFAMRVTGQRFRSRRAPSMPIEHPWDITPGEARVLQAKLAKSVDLSTPLPPWRTLAAADVSFTRYSPVLYAAVVVVEAGTFDVIEKVGLEAPAKFPYVPGLLSFREAPALLEAFGRLKTRPDVVLCDGQGIAHPRRLGIASHLGLCLDLPTVGCAKSILTGHHEPLSEEASSWVPLKANNEVIGAVLRTRARVKPMIISLGHRISLETSIRFVLDCCRGYRLPEPTRLADKLSKDNAWSE